MAEDMSLSALSLKYRDLLDYLRRDPRLSQQYTPLANIAQPIPSGFGSPNQILNDAGAASGRGLTQALDYTGITQPTPNRRVREGWGDAQQLIQWLAENRQRSMRGE